MTRGTAFTAAEPPANPLVELCAPSTPDSPEDAAGGTSQA